MSGEEEAQSDKQGLRPSEGWDSTSRPLPEIPSRGGTHPNNDAVVPLENGNELVPPQNLGLVQGPKSAEHLDATFVVGLCHGGRRLGAGHFLGGRDGACSGGGSSAEAESEDRCWVSGAEKALGAPG